MISIFDPAHPHYKVHKAFIEGSFVSPTNPPQVDSSVPGGPWYPTANPSWCMDTCYRIKPRMLTRTVTYPEPLRVAPEIGAVLWLVCAHIPQPEKSSWVGSHFQLQTFKNGVCFTNKADAQACYDTLFGEQK